MLRQPFVGIDARVIFTGNGQFAGRSGLALLLNAPFNSDSGPFSVSRATNATYRRASDGKWTVAGENESRREALGWLVEAYQMTNKCECYSTPGADQYGPELSSGVLTLGARYEITAHSLVDFTTAGAADNNIGTAFTAILALTMTADDKAKEVGGTDSDTSAFVSGLGTGAQQYHDGTTWQTSAIPGMTVASSSDTSTVLSIADDLTAINAFGELDLLNADGKVNDLTTGAGGSGSVDITGAMTATATQMQVYARVISGTATLSDSNGANSVALTGSTYSQGEVINFTATAGATIRITAGVSSQVRFLIPQLKEGDDQITNDSILLTNGASATRNKDVVTTPLPGNFSQTAGTLRVDVTFRYASKAFGVYQGLVGIRDSIYANPIYMPPVDGKFSTNDGTGGVAITQPWTADTTKKLGVVWGPRLQNTADGTSSVSKPYDGSFPTDANNHIVLAYGNNGPLIFANLKVWNYAHSDPWVLADTT